MWAAELPTALAMMESQAAVGSRSGRFRCLESPEPQSRWSRHLVDAPEEVEGEDCWTWFRPWLTVGVVRALITVLTV